jgi:hypothetical protein
MTACTYYRDQPCRIRLKLSLILFFTCIVICSSEEFDPSTSEVANHKFPIITLTPPLRDFFSKKIDVDGIPILAHQDVSDEAIAIAAQKFWGMVKNQPEWRIGIARSGFEIHIIGRNQRVVDLPEWQMLREKPLPLQVERTCKRGVTGYLMSCGEENLLGLPDDPYFGTDTLIERCAEWFFAAGISWQNSWRAVDLRNLMGEKENDKVWPWMASYSFFSTATCWYFGAQSTSFKLLPASKMNPLPSLREASPEVYALMDSIYGGSIKISSRSTHQMQPMGNRIEAESNLPATDLTPQEEISDPKNLYLNYSSIPVLLVDLTDPSHPRSIDKLRRNHCLYGGDHRKIQIASINGEVLLEVEASAPCRRLIITDLLLLSGGKNPWKENEIPPTDDVNF